MDSMGVGFASVRVYGMLKVPCGDGGMAVPTPPVVASAEFCGIPLELFTILLLGSFPVYQPLKPKPFKPSMKPKIGSLKRLVQPHPRVHLGHWARRARAETEGG